MCATLQGDDELRKQYDTSTRELARARGSLSSIEAERNTWSKRAELFELRHQEAEKQVCLLYRQRSADSTPS